MEVVDSLTLLRGVEAAEVDEKDGDVGGVDAIDTGSLADGGRVDALQLFAGLVA